MQGFAVFGTAIGEFAITWSGRGVVGVEWPRAAGTGGRRRPGAVETPPPPQIAAAIDGMVALLRGEARDLSAVILDMDGAPPLHRQVWALARTIPPGETRTYGEIAIALGDRLLAREVGQALGRNPFPIIVPCHRVLAAGGRIGGFSAPGGIDAKRRVLAIESVLAKREPGLFD